MILYPIYNRCIPQWIIYIRIWERKRRKKKKNKTKRNSLGCHAKEEKKKNRNRHKNTTTLHFYNCFCFSFQSAFVCVTISRAIFMPVFIFINFKCFCLSQSLWLRKTNSSFEKVLTKSIQKYSQTNK